MDFLERVFHVNVDSGNGTLEALYVVTAAVALAAIAFRRRIGRLISRNVAHRGR